MTTLPLAHLDTLGLDELLAEAELLTRVDRKYLLDRREAAGVLHLLDPRTRVLAIDGRRRFRYESVYFDTPDLLSYRQAALARRHRFKVRTRSYLDTDLAFLEVKVRGSRDVTVKDRISYDPDSRARLTELGRDYAGETLDERGLDGSVAGELEQTLLTRYERVTLLPPEPGVRVTVDTDLSWTDGEGDLSLPDLVIVETKSGPHPSGIDRLLWRSGHRPESVSKYGTGLAALRGDLPANKWARILRRHFTTTKETPCAA
ncbi:MAG: polyphosphate polymerase domain-containing protein [Propionicimonas sp.]|nr:polyphosphate polymerase domain-containing protein [Propionicimonas sp.]